MLETSLLTPQNLTSVELAQIKAANTVDSWNDVCDQIKDARGGEYPPDWFSKVIMSGLLASKGF